MGTTGVVAVVFTDLVGSTDLVARLGEERADQVRADHFATLREVVTRHSGTEVKNLGDGLMVAFPAASDAVACAVSLQQAVERTNRRAAEPLQMRVAVAAGEATCEGSDYFGTPVIEASRVCAQAGGGQILVTEMARALAGSRGGHRFESVGPMQLKGLPDPVSVHEAVWVPLADTAPALPPRLAVDRSLPFIGRTPERQMLEQAWKSAAQGTRRFVLLAGEPGIGKTRLATEMALAVHAEEGIVLLGSCDEDLAVPYQPFVEALRHLTTLLPEGVLAEALAERGGELARFLPELPGRVPGGLPAPQAADADSERYLLFAAVTELLAAASRWRPVLLVLDDLHWATKPTLLMLRHLVRSAEPMSLLVVGTYRDSDIGRSHPLGELLADLRHESGVERINLRGLSDHEAVALMENLAGHDLHGSELNLAHAVHEEADGSPFFMRELLRHFIEAGELVQEGDRWNYYGDVSSLGIPDSVREVIGRRVSRLPEPVDQLLTLGAVIGREFDVVVLAAVAELPRPEVIGALDQARKAALVREDPGSPGRFVFLHALIRHTLYEEIGPAQRMELHRAVAEAIESLPGHDEARVSQLAHHWVAATPAVAMDADDTVKAADYAEQAGRRAMASLAYEEAVHHLHGALRAVGLTGDGRRQCELLIDLGEAQRCAGDPTYRDTLLAASRSAQELGDAERAVRAALANQRGFWSQLWVVDRDRVAALEAAIDLAGPAPTAARARLLAHLASELYFAGENRRLELGREALELARKLGDPTTLAEVLSAVWLASAGGLAQAERPRLAAELVELTAGMADHTLQFKAGVALFMSASEEGDMERADRGLETLCKAAEELGQPLLRWLAVHLQIHRSMAAGRLREVEDLCQESQRLGEAVGQPDAAAWRAGPVAVVRLFQGRAEEAFDLMEPVARQGGAVVFRAGLACALAEMGRLEEAGRLVADMRPGGFAGIPADHLRIFTLGFLARACVRLDNADVASELYELLLPHRDRMVVSLTAWLGPATHHLGLLATVVGDFDAAEAHFQHAVEVQERLGARATLAHTRYEWGLLLLRRRGPGDREGARAMLQAALADARQADLPHIERRISEALGTA